MVSPETTEDVDTTPLEPTRRRTHEADEEFAALLMQP